MKEVLDYNVLPENYKLKIKIEEDYFTGEEEVILNIKKNTKQFNFNVWKMNLYDLEFEYEGRSLKPTLEDSTIEAPTLEDSTIEAPTLKTPTLKDQEEIATVYFTEELKENTKGCFRLKYKGVYSEDMWGFCKSLYNEDLLFSTDFEPTCARRAFPCWDQPDMKATFDISLCPLEGYGALSNSSLKEIKDGYHVFNTTPKMSTYIVAFISGKLEALEAKTKRNVPIGVYAHKDEKEWGRYALNVAVECLDFFEDYFDILYPLPKLDLVCIPAFVSGAMENWGLVTFRKTSLLLLDGSSSYRSKKLIAETVCHELAHMWFGNLVTMSWWNDLWLNEGFATWAASLALSNLNKNKNLVNWEVWLEFMNSDIEAGLLQDCLESSHPIAVEVNRPSEISQIFDTISYSKGASMIRMLEGFIGKDEFKKGIRNYLKKFQYSNATTKDLWKSFDNPEIERFMNDWINKQGYPLVTVSEEGDDLVLKQKQFLLSGRETDVIWQVPITFSWGETILMKTKEIRVKKKSSIYKINMGGYAFFRTSYTTQNLAHLLERCNEFVGEDKQSKVDTNNQQSKVDTNQHSNTSYTPLSISVEDKLNLINDIFALCNAKMMKAIDVIVLTELFRNESNPEILTSIFSTLNKFKSLWYENESVLKHLNEVCIDLIGPRVYDINIYTECFGEDWLTTNSLLVSNALRCQDPKIIKMCLEAYENTKKEGRKDVNKEENTKKGENNKGLHSKDKIKNVNPEFIRSVFIAVIDEKYEEIFKMAKTSTIPEDKIVALSSMARIKDPNNLSSILKKYNEIEPHNSIYFFLNLPFNEKNREIILNFICDHFDKIRSFMKNDRLFSYVVERVLSLPSTKPLAQKVIDLLNTKKNGEIEMAVNKAIEKIGWNLEFKEYNKEVGM